MAKLPNRRTSREAVRQRCCCVRNFKLHPQTTSLLPPCTSQDRLVHHHHLRIIRTRILTADAGGRSNWYGIIRNQKARDRGWLQVTRRTCQ